MASLRVMIVEDEPLIAMALEMLVQDEDGGGVVGPFATVAEAMAAVDGALRIDVAMLDCNLGKEQVWPVADALARRGVPFGFTSGQGARDIPQRFASAEVLVKPVPDEMVRRFIRRFSTPT
ncbi:MAG TPA: response regulator [Hyphomonadaceae bacterium]|nr:response regulator [Hyphomonadaceae bacterium]